MIGKKIDIVFCGDDYNEESFYAKCYPKSKIHYFKRDEISSTQIRSNPYKYWDWILDNKKHTSNTLEFLKVQSPHYKGESNYIEKQAVNDSDVITANGTATLEFTKEIMLYLKAKPVDKINKWYDFNKMGFY